MTANSSSPARKCSTLAVSGNVISSEHWNDSKITRVLPVPKTKRVKVISLHCFMNIGLLKSIKETTKMKQKQASGSTLCF